MMARERWQLVLLQFKKGWYCGRSSHRWCLESIPHSIFDEKRCIWPVTVSGQRSSGRLMAWCITIFLPQQQLSQNFLASRCWLRVVAAAALAVATRRTPHNLFIKERRKAELTSKMAASRARLFLSLLCFLLSWLEGSYSLFLNFRNGRSSSIPFDPHWGHCHHIHHAFFGLRNRCRVVRFFE
jgi:hypothetical protein